MKLNCGGFLVANEDARFYRWYGFDCFCALDIRTALANLPEDEALVLEINSSGGSVIAGSEIYAVLAEASRTRETRAEIQSLAASAASYMALGCRKVLISPVGMVMIHLPATSTEGDQAAHKQSIGMLDAATDAILNAYERKCGGKTSRDRLRAMMAKEKWFSAQEALDAGLVDGIIGQEEDEAAGDPKTLVNAAGLLRAGGGLPDLDKLRAAYFAAHPEEHEGEPKPSMTNINTRAALDMELLRI